MSLLSNVFVDSKSESDLLLFFKQKTAYEMRISDWSSDVCSSDLRLIRVYHDLKQKQAAAVGGFDVVSVGNRTRPEDAHAGHHPALCHCRSEERRVGQECVRTCRSRWSPYHLKKKMPLS